MIGIKEITELIEKKLEGTEQFLVEIKLSPDKLIVCIDKPSGIIVDECSVLNRYLVNELEPTGFIYTYEIEVSSPGMDQPLKVYQQYLRRIGKEMKVITADGKLHKGKLISADNNGFELLETSETKENKKKIKLENHIKLNYSQIKETKLEFKF